MRIRMKAMKGSHTKVGIQENSKAEDGVSDLVIIAAANEFGTQNIPERSFLRSTFDEQRSKINDITAAESIAVMDGKKDIETSLQQMGEWFQGEVQKKIYSHPPPPNAESTIERKGSSGTLVDSGQMVQSIRHVEIIPGRK